MRRTTTPTHTFTLEIDPNTITALNITYAQGTGKCCNGKDVEIILVKTLADCVIEDNAISVTLTQEETNLFTEDLMVEIQIHAVVGESSLMSDIMKVPCRRVLNDEVL